MEQRNQTHSPRCIWMDAGVVAYKLCDLEFRCDECAFDVTMRRPLADFHAKPPARTDARLSPEESIERYFSGFEPVQFPGDRMYVPGHLWILSDGDDSIILGIDHVASALVGPFISVVLPRQPMHIASHSPCCWFVHREGTISVSSPVDGTVISYNDRLTGHPELLSEKPYSQGWILKARITPSKIMRKTKRTASENASRISEELDVLKKTLVGMVQPRPGIGPSALDGGVLVRSPLEMIGPSAFTLIARLFLA